MVGKRQLQAVWALVAILGGVVLIQALLPESGVAQGKSLAARVAALEAKLACVTASGTDVWFAGCNVHILNGTGVTGTTNSLGNLIIGYNEDTGTTVVRTGSHNLVIGPEHGYSSYGGLVAGLGNTVSGPHASVSGGRDNLASGPSASVSGGGGNVATGNWASVSGGVNNGASGQAASVSGGADNLASGETASVSGGFANEASGARASVSGGNGGTAPDEYDWRAGDLFEDD